MVQRMKSNKRQAQLPATTKQPVKGKWGGARRGAGKHYPIAAGVRSLKNEVLTLRAKYGVMPLDYMLSVLNQEPPTRERNETDKDYLKRLARFEGRKDWAAMQAAPYLHHKLASIEITVPEGGAAKHDVDLTKLSDKELDQLESLVYKASKQSSTLTLDEDQYYEVE